MARSQKRGFVRVPGGYVLRVPPDWWELLQSLVRQLVELLQSAQAPREPAPQNPLDPFQAWEAEFDDVPGDRAEHEDPALRRLFPNPYPADAEAAWDHRRFAEPEQNRRKVAEAEQVLAHLAAGPDALVPDAAVDVWLRTLNAVRLVLASRLGIESEADHEALAELDEDDPRWMMGAVMEALAELQTQLIVYGEES